MGNPFFSGRIPQALYNKVEEYCKEAGKGKTEILIEALAKYLEFPIEKVAPKSEYVTLEIFNSLSEEVQSLNRKIGELQNKIDVVITPDNKAYQKKISLYQQHDDNFTDSKGTIDNKIIHSDNADNKDAENTIDENDNKIDNIDNKELPSENEEYINADNDDVIKVDNNPIVDNIIVINNDNKDKLNKLLVYKSISSQTLRQVANITQAESVNLKTQAFSKAKKDGYEIVEEVKFRQPIETILKRGIFINGQKYNLYCEGTDNDKKPIWTLELNDNNIYHTENEEIHLENKNDNINYHSDNNNTILIPFDDN